jgi:hypothetical protein
MLERVEPRERSGHRISTVSLCPSRLVERALRYRREIAQEPEQLALQETTALDDALGEIVGDAGAVRGEQVIEKRARCDLRGGNYARPRSQPIEDPCQRTRASEREEIVELEATPRAKTGLGR